jgi:hypothetical protein
MLACIPYNIETKSKMNNEYTKKYKTDAILIRDELLSRLPSEPRDDLIDNLYIYLNNPFGLNMVIDDLEKLSKRSSN